MCDFDEQQNYLDVISFAETRLSDDLAVIFDIANYNLSQIAVIDMLVEWLPLLE